VMDGITVPDAIDPIVGWRYWRMDRTGHLLASLGGSGRGWKAGRPKKASCASQRNPNDFRFEHVSGIMTASHESPEERCRCGIYAARTLEELRSQMLLGLGIAVVGEVLLWGKVIPGSRGYRAQYAYPKHLYVMARGLRREGRMMEALRIYGTPVESMRYEDATFSPALALTMTVRKTAAVLGRIGQTILDGSYPERDEATSR
jgi:hypothetical protein